LSHVSGYTDQDGSELSDVKLETTVLYDEACDPWGTDYVAEVMLCGDGGGANDTCFGDSGGPILIKGDDDASDIQVGVSCGDRIGLFCMLRLLIVFFG